MKILLLLLIPAVSFANGITLNVGGGWNYTTLTPNVSGKTYSELGDYITKAIGGGYNIELGYLWHTEDKVIHAVDSRIGFAQGFNDIYKILSGGVNPASFVFS